MDPLFTPNAALRQMLIAMMLREALQGEQGGQEKKPGSGGRGVGSLIRLFGAGGAGAGGAAALTGGGAATVIPAGAAVPAGFTAVGTSVTGGTMIAPTASIGAAGASAGAGAAGTGAAAGTAGTATSGVGAGIGTYAFPVAVGAALVNNAWETGMKDILRGRGDRADWTNQAANMTGIGALGNIGLRLLGKRSIGAMMKSGKSQAERIRDDFRGALKESGIADNDYMITLADGSKYNVGLGGKHQLQNVGQNIDGRNTRNTWDVDWSNPLSKFATDRIDPMVRGVYGADAPDKKFYPGHLTGMLVNAVMSNAKNEQDITKNIERVLGSTEFAKATGQEAASAQPAVVRPGRGQVARVSPGIYMNDRGQVGRAMTSSQAMKQNYGNRIPRKGKR